MSKNLYEKIFDSHTVKKIGGDQYQLFIGLHLLHEATTAPAFSAIREKKLSIKHPDRTFATADHVIPTTKQARPFLNEIDEAMVSTLEHNTEEFGIRFFSLEDKENGIVHVIGPERGLTQPGMTIVCGDSHTSTHGAFGSIAMGIGTTQVRDVLATQSLVTQKLKVRKIEVTGTLQKGVTAKDVVLHIIRVLGIKIGSGYAYEFSGNIIKKMTMEQRMTVCNMAIEAGARCGYINPDEITFEYLKGKEYAPKKKDWDKAIEYWKSVASDEDAKFNDVVNINAGTIEPMTTWGVNLEQAINITENIPALTTISEHDKKDFLDALEYMQFEEAKKIEGTAINVAFIGSCTNGRLSDFKQVIDLLKSGDYKVADGIKALIVPGSQYVAKQMREQGWDKIFTERGFEFREPGCSMCLAMNPDKLQGRQLCASSSNRNFRGRQGSPTGRTLVMSPISVAACAVTGIVSDPRKIFKL